MEEDRNDGAVLIGKTYALPCSEAELRELAYQYPTPFYLYDKEKIVNRAKHLNASFAWTRSLAGSTFKNHFAVKATPNPMIVNMLHEECDMGVDCSSLTELILCEKLGINGEDVMFTSNNTPFEAYRKAFDMGAIINLDDYFQIENLKKALGGVMPEVIAFRFNPGSGHSIKYNEYIGNPVEAKFGMTKAQLFSAYKKCKEYGVKRFGVHTMVVSNSLDVVDLVETVRMMFTLAVEIKSETGISVEFVNMGGGIGVPYHPEDMPVDLEDLGYRVKCLYEEIVLPHLDLHPPQIKYECGGVVTGEFGWLVSRVINMKDTYKSFLGVDAVMVDQLQPGTFGQSREITIVKDQSPPNDLQKNLPDHRSVVSNPSYAYPNHFRYKKGRTFDVVGSLCTNIDKYAADRVLNVNPEIGDLCIFHSAGAYGRGMDFNFNATLRHAEILRVGCNRFEMIRRAETCDDYFATLKFPIQ